jgi:hypothetical protein
VCAQFPIQRDFVRSSLREPILDLIPKLTFPGFEQFMIAARRLNDLAGHRISVGFQIKGFASFFLGDHWDGFAPGFTMLIKNANTLLS